MSKTLMPSAMDTVFESIIPRMVVTSYTIHAIEVLNARYLPLKKAWLLVHTHLGHNHPPNPKVILWKARQPKSLTILPPEQPPSNHPNAQVKTPDNTSTQRLASPSDPVTNNTIISQLPGLLQALTPRTQTTALVQIQSILSDLAKLSKTHHAPNLTKPILPLSFTLEEPHAEDFPHEVLESPPAKELEQDHVSDELINCLIEDLYGLSEVTESTFNIDDLLTQPNALEPHQEPSPHGSPISKKQPQADKIKSFGSLNPIESDGDNACIPAAPLPIPNITNRLIDVQLENSQMHTTTTKHQSQQASSQEKPLGTDTQLANNQTSSAVAPFDNVRVTRKHAREEAMLKSPVPNPALPELLVEYRIHSWLQPFVLDLRQVRADGHCGF
ncbi:hypothetical protein DFH28DRAFT_1121800 [Melampsora americana]|nr:hypothetical protein DFH28DRAFT_1121800 [Melampsora americana]